MATAIDLAGRDVFPEAVQMSVNPKSDWHLLLLLLPKTEFNSLLKHVLPYANIRQLVGGAGEDTILARVGRRYRIFHRFIFKS